MFSCVASSTFKAFFRYLTSLFLRNPLSLLWFLCPLLEAVLECPAVPGSPFALRALRSQGTCAGCVGGSRASAEGPFSGLGCLLPTELGRGVKGRTGQWVDWPAPPSLRADSSPWCLLPLSQRRARLPQSDPGPLGPAPGNFQRTASSNPASVSVTVTSQRLCHQLGTREAFASVFTVCLRV